MPLRVRRAGKFVPWLLGDQHGLPPTFARGHTRKLSAVEKAFLKDSRNLHCPKAWARPLFRLR